MGRQMNLPVTRVATSSTGASTDALRFLAAHALRTKSTIMIGPPTNSAAANCQPISTARMMPSSCTRLVEANWNPSAASGPAPPRHRSRRTRRRPIRRLRGGYAPDCPAVGAPSRPWSPPPAPRPTTLAPHQRPKGSLSPSQMPSPAHRRCHPECPDAACSPSRPEAEIALIGGCDGRKRSHSRARGRSWRQ